MIRLHKCIKCGEVAYAVMEWPDKPWDYMCWNYPNCEEPDERSKRDTTD